MENKELKEKIEQIIESNTFHVDGSIHLNDGIYDDIIALIQSERDKANEGINAMLQESYDKGWNDGVKEAVDTVTSPATKLILISLKKSH